LIEIPPSLVTTVTPWRTEAGLARDGKLNLNNPSVDG